MSSNLRTALVLRREIATVKDPRELSRLLNPVIGWSDFSPPGPNKPPSLGGFEGNPTWFFDHTFPTKAIKTIISGIKAKLERKAPGILPVKGYLGTGKSHLLLTIYHLLLNHEPAAKWLGRWKIDFEPHDDIIVIPIPLQAMRIANLWEPFFEVLQYPVEIASDDWPRRPEVAEAVKKAKATVVFLIDELDTWYDAKSDQDQARNRGFIQSLAEASAEEDVPLITIVVSLGLSEPLKIFLEFAARNVGGSLTVLDKPEDILEVVRFRLFQDIDHDAVKEVVRYYIELYRKLGIRGLESMRGEMERHFPFHPALFRPLSSVGVRQLLQMLAWLTIANIDSSNLLLISNIDEDMTNAFVYQVDERLVSAYFDDVRFISAHPDVREEIISQGLAKPFLLASLLNTLREGAGSTYEDMIFAAIRKDTPKGEITQVLDFLEKWTRISKIGEKYKFTVDLPVPVKITRRAGLIDPPVALRRIDEVLQRILRKEIVGFRVVYEEDLKDDERFRLVVLKGPPADPEILYKDLKLENTLLFLYPQQSLAQGQTLWAARQVLACEELVGEDETKKEQYEKFKEEFLESLEDKIREAEWRLLIWSRTSPKEAPKKADTGVPDFRRIKDLISKQSSKDMIKYFVSLIVEGERKITVKDIKLRLMGLRGAPILINYGDLLNSLSDMALEGEIVIRTPQGLSYYKKRVRTETISDDALVEKPETVEHISIEETYKLLKEKGSLGFYDLRQTFPVSDESRIEEVVKELSTRYEDAYILEEGKIVSTMSDPRKGKLFSLEKVSSLIEGHVTALVNDTIAIKLGSLLEKVKQEHSGVDEKLLNYIVEELDIVGKVRIDREKGSVSVPPYKLDEELKRRIRTTVRRKGKLTNEDLVEEMTKQIPVDDQIIKNVLALLCDEGIEIECSKGMVSRRTRPGARVGKEKPLRFEKEGTAKELGATIESELAGEYLEYVQLTVREGVDASLIKEALEALNTTKTKLIARRRA